VHENVAGIDVGNESHFVHRSEVRLPTGTGIRFLDRRFANKSDKLASSITCNTELPPSECNSLLQTRLQTPKPPKAVVVGQNKFPVRHREELSPARFPIVYSTGLVRRHIPRIFLCASVSPW
jgi:hypothetical protein